MSRAMVRVTVRGMGHNIGQVVVRFMGQVMSQFTDNAISRFMDRVMGSFIGWPSIGTCVGS